MPTVLQWFDENPARYWWLVCLAVSAVFFAAIRPLLRSEAKLTSDRSDWIWGLAIFALLLAGRWPSLFISTDFNADESQMIAGAITLRHDPIFWRSVDGNTAGPLDFYALLPAGSIAGSDSYLSARITALFLLTFTLLFLHIAISRITGRTAARLGGLSTLCFEAFTTHSDFLHYSTALMPLALIAAGILIGVREATAATPNLAFRFFFGLLLGAVPFAKLQGAPLGFYCAAALFLADLVKHGRNYDQCWRVWAAMVLGAIIPCLFFATMVLACGEWQDAITSYITSNLGYVASSTQTVGATVTGLIASVSHQGDLVSCWLAGTTAMCLCAMMVKPHRTGKTWLPGLVAVCLFVTIASILVPNRASAHYLHFLVIPLTLLGGWSAGVLAEAWRENQTPQRRLVMGSALLLGGLAVLSGRCGRIHPLVGHLAASYYRTPSQAVRTIRQITQSGESLAVWGWMSAYHVETGLRQALHESHSVEQIHEWPLQSFYRKRYLADMIHSRPPVFVDAVGPGNFAFHDRKKEAHDAIFPALSAYISSHYLIVADVNGSRIYLRNDLLERARISVPAINP